VKCNLSRAPELRQLAARLCRDARVSDETAGVLLVADSLPAQCALRVMQLATQLADAKAAAAATTETGAAAAAGAAGRVAVAMTLTAAQLPPRAKRSHSVYVLNGHELATVDVEAPPPLRSHAGSEASEAAAVEAAASEARRRLERWAQFLLDATSEAAAATVRCTREGVVCGGAAVAPASHRSRRAPIAAALAAAAAMTTTVAGAQQVREPR